MRRRYSPKGMGITEPDGTYPPKPVDLRPVGSICALGGIASRVRVVDHIFDRHALGGWGYLLIFTNATNRHVPFKWPHHDGSLGDISPLETLALQAE